MAVSITPDPHILCAMRLSSTHEPLKYLPVHFSQDGSHLTLGIASEDGWVVHVNVYGRIGIWYTLSSQTITMASDSEY